MSDLGRSAIGCSGPKHITHSELARQALEHDAETLVEWWLALTYELHFRCRSDELPELLAEALCEPSDAGREAA